MNKACDNKDVSKVSDYFNHLKHHVMVGGDPTTEEIDKKINDIEKYIDEINKGVPQITQKITVLETEINTLNLTLKQKEDQIINLNSTLKIKEDDNKFLSEGALKDRDDIKQHAALVTQINNLTLDSNRIKSEIDQKERNITVIKKIVTDTINANSIDELKIIRNNVTNSNDTNTLDYLITIIDEMIKKQENITILNEEIINLKTRIQDNLKISEKAINDLDFNTRETENLRSIQAGQINTLTEKVKVLEKQLETDKDDLNKQILEKDSTIKTLNEKNNQFVSKLESIQSNILEIKNKIAIASAATSV
jgi:chromosome segregation ATPase